MQLIKFAGGFDRLDILEARLCIPCNGFAKLPAVRRYFTVVSRLGDGLAWYAMLAVLPLVYGQPAYAPALHMIATGLVGVLIYKLLKGVLIRERPFASHPQVLPLTRPLDRCSFPSGHTMHAVCFLTMLATFFPPVMWLMLPFGISVALSRVMLGLHYPSDVLAGAAIGWTLASGSLFFYGV